MPRYTRGASEIRVRAAKLEPQMSIIDPAQTDDQDTKVVVDAVSRPDADGMVTLIGRRGSGATCEIRVAGDWPIVLHDTQRVGFTRYTPDHLAHLDLGDANELIDFVLHQSQPERYPAAAKLRAVAAIAAMIGLVVVVLSNFRGNQHGVIALCAAVAGWLSSYGVSQWRGARHGVANDHISEIIAEHERRQIEEGRR